VRGLYTFALAILFVVNVSADIQNGNLAYCDASPNIVIVVTHDGAPLRNAPVDIYHKLDHGERLAWRGITSKDGQGRPSALEEGSYRVFVDAGKQVGTIKPAVTRADATVTTCELNVATVVYTSPPEPVAESSSVVELRALRGVISDDTGAVVQRAKVTLQQKNGTQVQDIGSMATDERGAFDFGDRAAGDYLVRVEAKGFCHSAAKIRLSKAGWSGMRVELPVLGVCRGDDLRIVSPDQ
jgi:hypothetical protein